MLKFYFVSIIFSIFRTIFDDLFLRLLKMTTKNVPLQTIMNTGYFQMLAKKGQYIIRSLDKVEQDLTNVQNLKNKTFSQFLQILRHIVSIHEIIVNQIKTDLSMSELESIGQGIEKLFIQSTSMIFHLIKMLGKNQTERDQIELFQNDHFFGSKKNSFEEIEQQLQKKQHLKYEISQIYRLEREKQHKQIEIIWELLNKNLKKQYMIGNQLEAGDQAKYILEAYNTLQQGSKQHQAFVTKMKHRIQQCKQKENFMSYSDLATQYKTRMDLLESSIKAIFMKLRVKPKKIKTKNIEVQTVNESQSILSLQNQIKLQKNKLRNAFRLHADQIDALNKQLQFQSKSIKQLEDKVIDLTTENERLSNLLIKARKISQTQNTLATPSDNNKNDQNLKNNTVVKKFVKILTNMKENKKNAKSNDTVQRMAMSSIKGNIRNQSIFGQKIQNKIQGLVPDKDKNIEKLDTGSGHKTIHSSTKKRNFSMIRKSLNMTKADEAKKKYSFQKRQTKNFKQEQLVKITKTRHFSQLRAQEIAFGIKDPQQKEKKPELSAFFNLSQQPKVQNFSKLKKDISKSKISQQSFPSQKGSKYKIKETAYRPEDVKNSKLIFQNNSELKDFEDLQQNKFSGSMTPVRSRSRHSNQQENEKFKERKKVLRKKYRCVTSLKQEVRQLDSHKNINN